MVASCGASWASDLSDLSDLSDSSEKGTPLSEKGTSNKAPKTEQYRRGLKSF